MYLIKNTVPVLEENKEKDIRTAIDIVFGNQNQDAKYYEFITSNFDSEFLVEKANALIIQSFLEEKISPLLVSYLTNKFTRNGYNRVEISSINWERTPTILYLATNNKIELDNDTSLFFTQHQLSLNIYDIHVFANDEKTYHKYTRFYDTLLGGSDCDKAIFKAIAPFATTSISQYNPDNCDISIELAPTLDPERLFEMIDLLFQL